jgi:hypothetical protein
MPSNSKKIIYGSQTPRLESAPLKNRSLGPLVADLADSLGTPLMPWQKYVLNQGLQLNEQNKFIRTTAGCLVARQSGKTHLMRLRILAGLVIFGEAQIYGIAQNRRLSLDTLNKTLELAESAPWISRRIKRVIRTNGNEAIEIYCHHYPKSCPGDCVRVRKYGILAATTDGARGASANLLYVDELREIGPEVWAAAGPITRAKGGEGHGAQTWITSNAGTAESVVLNELRARALRDDSPRLGWWEWSAPQDCKIDDINAIRAANPGLGYTVQLDSLMDSVTRDNPDNVRTELLCQWISNFDNPYNLDTFDLGRTDNLVMDPKLPTYMGLDLDFNRQNAYLISAQITDDGVNVFAHSWQRDEPLSETMLASEIAVIARQFNTKQIAYDPRAADHVAAHLRRTGLRMEATPWGGSLFPTLCDYTANAINQARVSHPGQPDVREQLAMCTRRPAGDGGWRIARKGAGSIPAAVAFNLAVGYTQIPKVSVTSMVG